ncbi:hypothetical protein JTE90_004435 [Oedothorax gibbosus]|uniref:FAM234A/B beta-propeller domain-containing protein n=1 Tax=Oedothorax gibbosus TaxID=931172 RepID=A0AAV6UQL5_9ARAC|nr:hypothetical protein JTE90_004435 [Oedothorax gibbosus]
MKLNATPRHYMPLPQNQSDDDESVPSKEDKLEKVIFKNSYEAAEGTKSIRIIEQDEIDVKDLPMSPSRVVLFTMSLLMCVFFVMIFVFCVPCTLLGNLNELCYLTFEWGQNLPNTTYAAPVEFIDHEALENRIIVLGYTSIESGLVAIQINDGKEIWRLHLHSKPLSLSCHTLDVNSDKVPECLVIGEDGLLTAVDAKEGVSLWYLHNHSNLNSANSISGPVVVSDCDDDDIMDIIISYNITGEEKSYLAIVSGGTGQIIGSLIELSQCFQPSLMKFSWKSKELKQLVLHCKTETNDELWLLSAKDICNAANNETSTLVQQNIFRIPHFKNDIKFYEIVDSNNQFVVVLDGIQFILLKCSHVNFQTIWHTYVDTGYHMRIVSDGQYINGSSQLVIANAGGIHYKILGLSLEDGREVWSILNDSGTVVSVTKFPNFFGSTDGLLLKLVAAGPPINPHAFELGISRNVSEQTPAQKLKVHRVETLRSLQETYMFVKCGKVPVFKTILEEIIRIDCQVAGSCFNNIYTINSTVIAKSDDFGNSFSLFTVTSSEVFTSNTKEMIVKRYNLNDVTDHPTCENHNHFV